VVKVTGKYTPINQWLYLDACEVLPNDAEGAGAGEEFTPTGDRYTHLHTLLGATFTAKLRDQRVFLVGAGALGCEFLKNFALLGVSTGAGGHVMVTDMDRIEVSNLNRQFLFRSDNVGKPKSVTAAAAAVRMNGDMKIDATEVPVGHDTENTFDDAFWEGRDVVVNALDNVKARLYVDGKCVWHGLPLLESGTLGTKANTQVVAPHKTESYGDSVDPPEESIPMCTLKNFPYKIEHCIQWARDLFEGSFAASVQEAASFAADPAKWLANLASEGNMHARRLKLEAVQAALAAADGATFEGCVAQARRLFHTSFHTNIRQLLHNFPADYVDSKGNKFWSGTKRTPTAADFNSTDEGHLAFIAAATHLVAANYGVSLPEGWSTPDVLGPLLERVTVEPFVPRSVRIKADDGDATNEGADDDEVVVERLIGELRAVADKEDLSKVALAPAEFEKDDDTNFHVDFITAAANLRARNYDLKTASRHQCKMIAGKIIPAIATTTCAVTGLVCLELIKIIKGEPLESYRNTFMNLAINLFSMAEPGEPKRVTSKDFDPMVGGPVKAKPEGFSNWDKLVIKEGPLTCNQLVAYVERTQGVEVSMISAGALMLFAPLMYASHRARGDQDVKAVWEAASKSEVGGGRKYIVLDIACEDDDGDVVIPTVQYFFE
jgi:ubiquitin-activating enzyme E1